MVPGGTLNKCITVTDNCGALSCGFNEASEGRILSLDAFSMGTGCLFNEKEGETNEETEYFYMAIYWGNGIICLTG